MSYQRAYKLVGERMDLRRNHRRVTFRHHTTKLDLIHIISPNKNKAATDGYMVIANLVEAQKSTRVAI